MLLFECCTKAKGRNSRIRYLIAENLLFVLWNSLFLHCNCVMKIWKSYWFCRRVGGVMENWNWEIPQILTRTCICWDVWCRVTSFLMFVQTCTTPRPCIVRQWQISSPTTRKVWIFRFLMSYTISITIKVETTQTRRFLMAKNQPKTKDEESFRSHASMNRKKNWKSKKNPFFHSRFCFWICLLIQ